MQSSNLGRKEKQSLQFEDDLLGEESLVAMESISPSGINKRVGGDSFKRASTVGANVGYQGNNKKEVGSN
jgi:hypothetical protein